MRAQVEAQLENAMETFLDHQSFRRIKARDLTGGSSVVATSDHVASQETDTWILRCNPDKQNVAIIKIEPDKKPSNKISNKSYCSSKVTIKQQQPGISDNSNLAFNLQNQQSSNINQFQSLPGSKRNSRSHSVKITCNAGTQIRNLKNSKLPINSVPTINQVSGTNNSHINLRPSENNHSGKIKDFANDFVRKSERFRVSQSPSDNIVRRSKSVVIHCNRTDPAQTFPLPSSDLEDHNIQENLDDIKLEIEKLIEEREKIIKENNFLQYYKKAYKKLKQENLQLRRKMMRLSARDDNSETPEDTSEDVDDEASDVVFTSDQERMTNISPSTNRVE